MLQVIGITDKDGYFVTNSYLNVESGLPPCTKQFYRAKWNGTAWVESLPQAEIDEIIAEQQAVEQIGTNKLSIEDYLKLAITDNKTYLALTPTTAQNTTQIKKLTRQNNKIIRLLTNLLEDTE